MKYKVLRFDSLNSTQEKAKSLSKKGLKNIIVVAKKQTKGKGRFKRRWFSKEGNLYMSILFKA